MKPSRRRRAIGSALAGLALALALLPSCFERPGGQGSRELAALATKGRAVYQLNCTQCHHPDPAKVGTLGPEVRGASLELLTAKILEGKYPPGYEPKRKTMVMPPMIHLKADLEALKAYLGSG
jgi:mono/diheme cytochrome c family protein